jgi:hypothetical protein
MASIIYIIIDIQEEDEDIVITNANNNLFDDQHDTKLQASLLKLKISNTTEYLNWRIAILKRDNFKCRMCTTSIKGNKALRLEVHHAKSFDDICKENNITTIKQALACKQIWSLDNGISLCYGFHKALEKLSENKEHFCITYPTIIIDYGSSMLASFAILAGGLAALYGLDWYKNRKQNRRLARKVGKEENYNAKEPLAEQLA